ncbi:hypothetical protein [Streptomyces sp. NPDC048248]|uniref:hypothetical protein n=1 Tax=Streptomyces sp. NPDC048248 TaxID=3365523 RepID=UPI003710FF85
MRENRVLDVLGRLLLQYPGVRRLEISLVGRDVQSIPAPRTRAAHRHLLGDYSKVQISS